MILAGHRGSLRRLPALAVLDAAWSLLADRAIRADENRAANGKQPEVLDRLTVDVWGLPDRELPEGVDDASEDVAMAELAAMVEAMNGVM